MNITHPTTPLRQRMLEDLQLRNFSPSTIESYIRAVAAFAKHFNTSPEKLGPEHIRQYQLHLVRRQVSWSLVIQVVSALRFFYNVTINQGWMIDYIPQPKRPQKLPTILSQEEVAALLRAPTHLKSRAILTTLYATGIRVSELCNLQVQDVDSSRMVVSIRQGKGQQDRTIMLSPRLVDILRQYWLRFKPQTYLFPGPDPTRALTRNTVGSICHTAGQNAKLTKAVHPHSLRHAFASHLLEQGVDLRRLQLVLGHKHMRTTSRYLHVNPHALHSIISPLDHLPTDSEPDTQS
jgi:site-specific recombinase XerD